MKTRFQIAVNFAKTGFRGWLLATLLGVGCGLLFNLHGADRIYAYRDSSGRVIFANDAPAEPADPQTNPPATQDSQGLSSGNGVASGPKKGIKVEPAAANQQRESIQPVAPVGAHSSFDDMIERTAAEHQVDPELIRAMVKVESNFNARAVSSRGAIGLMQLIPATARRFGVTNILDPNANLSGGVRYIKYLMDLFGGDVQLSLAAYNAGEHAVDRHYGVPPFPETRNYLRKISEIYPLYSPTIIPAQTEKIENVMVKSVDTKGIVHFSNVD